MPKVTVTPPTGNKVVTSVIFPEIVNTCVAVKFSLIRFDCSDETLIYEGVKIYPASLGTIRPFVKFRIFAMVYTPEVFVVAL